MSSFRLLCQALPAALLLFATPTLDAQTVEFGTLLVTQLANNNNNLITPPPGISIAYGPGKSAAGGFAITANRADYDMDFGHANDTTTGMLMSSLAQLTRNDSAVGGPAPGAFYATSSSWIGTSKYTIAIHWSESNPDNTEVNYNTSYAFLPYNIFIGGIANNSSNNGEMTSLTGTTGLTLNTHFTDLSTPAGQYAVNLTGLVTNASQNGILLVTGAKNEDNYALSRANADGTFNIWCKDNANGTNTVFENDAVAFSYIPTSAIGTQGLTAIGRVNGNATTDVAAGTFTVTKGGTGQWYLQISGHSQSTGTLIISPEGGGTNNVDNIIASGWDAANNRWVIESRDINAVTPHVPTLQDMANATEDAFSFAFFAASNIAPVASITAPAASSFVTPATFTLEADATDANGSVTTVEFLRNGLVVGTDNSQPYTYTETGLTNGSYSYVARATDNSGATGVSTAKVITVTFDPNNLPANTALSFDGLNDYVTMGAAPELNVGGPPNNGLTLECWFRKEGTGITAGSGSGGVTAVPLFGKGRGESDGSNIDCNIFFGITTGGILVADFESQATGLNHPITATNAPIVNGTWYHAAVTYDGATSTWKMYLNGDEVGTATPSVAGSVPRFDSIQHFGIGTAMNSSGATEGAFAGVIDEARVWNRARSAAEIAAAKDLELSSGTGLIGRFGLNEATSTTAASSTGVSVGTLTNGPVWVPGAPFATANTSPTVTLTAPLNNAPSFMPFPVTFMADASDVGGSVTKIEFLVAGLKVGEDTTEPFTYAWTPPAIGTYSVRARAIDNLGATKLSTPADLIIQPNPNQPPVITLTAPADGATVTGTSTLLEANLADSTGDAMTVTFYGRQTVPAAPGADFTVVAIPDTQYYSEGSPSRANTVTVEQLIGTFGAQTQWVVDNQTSRNVAFLSHMGDIVENGNFNGNPIQWQRASAAMGRLENPVAALRAHGIPYGIAPGNHDIDPIGSYDSGSTTFYNQFFNLSRFAGRTYWGGNYGSDNTNNYQLFSASGLDFIAIHMAYDTTPNQPILDWADALMKAHPQRRAIVTSHYIIGQGNPAAFGAQGQAFYTNFKDNPNFFLMLCGHIHAEGRRSDIFEGRTVYSVLSDYQGLINGGQGFLRTLSFSPANNRIRVESWSPTLNRAAQASDGLPHFDGTFDLPYNMQSPISGWVPLGTVNVPANGTSASLNWTGLAAGKNYEWYVAANDGVNTASSAPHRFTTAAGIAPTVTLDTPATGATFLSPATINLTATAADADGSIVRVEFYQAGTKVGEDTTEPYEFTWSGVPVGSYTLSAVAVDNSNLASVSTAANVTVNPGDLPPTVTLTAPVAGTLLEAPANVTLTADASDQDGPVAKVEFYSGTLPPVLLGEETTVPFSLTLTNLGAGSYTFSAKATDSIGQTTTSATVTMSIFTEAAAPNVGTLSVGAFDPPSWTVTRTSPAPRHFNLPGSASGSLELKINSASVPFSSGIALVNNWNSLATIAAGFTSDDNISQPFANGSGNTFINVLDNSNNNAVGANPSTSAQTSGVGVAFLPYAAGWTGASVNSAAGVIASNLPAGVSMVNPAAALTPSRASPSRAICSPLPMATAARWRITSAPSASLAVSGSLTPATTRAAPRTMNSHLCTSRPPPRASMRAGSAPPVSSPIPTLLLPASASPPAPAPTALILPLATGPSSILPPPPFSCVRMPLMVVPPARRWITSSPGLPTAIASASSLKTSKA